MVVRRGYNGDGAFTKSDAWQNWGLIVFTTHIDFFVEDRDDIIVSYDPASSKSNLRGAIRLHAIRYTGAYYNTFSIIENQFCDIEKICEKFDNYWVETSVTGRQMTFMTDTKSTLEGATF